MLDSIHLSLDPFVDDGERSTDEAPNSAQTPLLANHEIAEMEVERLLTPATAVAVLFKWRCAKLKLAPKAARPRRDGTPMAGRHGAGATVGAASSMHR